MSDSKGAAIEKLLEKLTVETGEEYHRLHSGKLSFEIADSRMRYYEKEATQAILALLAQEVNKARIDELEGFLERTVHKDKQPGDLDKDGNRMQMKVRTGYNYAKAEMRHDIKDRLERLG